MGGCQQRMSFFFFLWTRRLEKEMMHTSFSKAFHLAAQCKSNSSCVGARQAGVCLAKRMNGGAARNLWPLFSLSPR